MDWSKLPDLVAVVLLTGAFASAARRGETPVSGLWLTGWILISVHFAASMVAPFPGRVGTIATDLGLASLVDAGVLFMYASVPYRRERSSQWMLASLLVINTFYVCLCNASPALDWALTPVAIAIGAVPLALALYIAPRFQHALRWMVVSLYCGLAVYLLAVQHLPGTGADLAIDGALFAVYFGCCLHVWYTYRRMSAGALITIFGFFSWASVFVIGPILEAYRPGVQVESEVWNLPKYVVAVGMILLLLEDQLEHNKFLALHDELTGLPNRRLFQDRLTLALERAKRSGTKAALMVVDLDQFKQVNDTLGHHAGDQLLQKVGAIFTNRVRITDTVARTGGDEFSVILEGTEDQASASHVAESLIQQLHEPLEVNGRMIWVGASVGVAVFPDDAGDMESLCIAADLRMYDQKGGGAPRPTGTGGLRPYPPPDDALPSEFRLASERFHA
ncbi:MAG TPA: GGDEF domain-containing protein [Terracidiphilus sp.]|nr:GGDEF domain-containing protein [Terracidiphilus sp.]